MAILVALDKRLRALLEAFTQMEGLEIFITTRSPYTTMTRFSSGTAVWLDAWT